MYWVKRKQKKSEIREPCASRPYQMIWCTYTLLHDDASLLHGSMELVEIDLARVLDVEILKHFLKELHLVDIGRILLRNLGSQLILEPVANKALEKGWKHNKYNESWSPFFKKWNCLYFKCIPYVTALKTQPSKLTSQKWIHLLQKHEGGAWEWKCEPMEHISWPWWHTKEQRYWRFDHFVGGCRVTWWDDNA